MFWLSLITNQCVYILHLSCVQKRPERDEVQLEWLSDFCLPVLLINGGNYYEGTTIGDQSVNGAGDTPVMAFFLVSAPTLKYI